MAPPGMPAGTIIRITCYNNISTQEFSIRFQLNIKADLYLSRLAVHLLSRNMRAKVGLAMGWLARVEAGGCKDWVACDCHGAWQVWSW